MTDGPLIVQSDQTVLLEVAHPQADRVRREIAVFAELERAPEHIHSYRITQLGLWNARAAGHDAAEIISVLESNSKFPVPPSIISNIEDTISRYGRLEIVRDTSPDAEPEAIVLRAKADPGTNSENILAEVARNKRISPLLIGTHPEGGYLIEPWARGELKQRLLKIAWPAEDLAGYRPGTPHPIELDQSSWQLRPYQREAVSAFAERGSGLVVLPCGAGKTIVGAAAMGEVKAATLILVTNTVSARQWRNELLKRTDLSPEDIGEYSGEVKEIKPVTIASYQILTAKRAGKYAHLAVLDAADWGLIIYDEVHLLPAPVFKLTAELQARRRLGLTATLVREDGREGDVFSLIGPKRFDAPWKEIQEQGFISPAQCYEVRVELSADERNDYANADDGERYRIAASSQRKIEVAKQIMAQHPEDGTLIIGQYLDQLDDFAEALDAPKITGATPVNEREELYQGFRDGKIKTLVVSKVANFSVDLPDASVAIQISGAFGSRQEEAQRLGRILRPKAKNKTAHFYTLVAQDTVDQQFAQNRQRFLAEQGYQYTIAKAESENWLADLISAR